MIGRVISIVGTGIVVVFLGTTAVSTVNVASRNFDHKNALGLQAHVNRDEKNSGLTDEEYSFYTKGEIVSKNMLKKFAGNEFTKEEFKKKMQNSKGEYKFLKILNAPGATVGNCLGGVINYLFNVEERAR